MERSQEVFRLCGEKGQAGEALRVAHDRQLYREFLARLPAHSTIAVEASGSYSWLVDEMERSGQHPKLCNPLFRSYLAAGRSRTRRGTKPRVETVARKQNALVPRAKID